MKGIGVKGECCLCVKEREREREREREGNVSIREFDTTKYKKVYAQATYREKKYVFEI